MTDQLTIVIGSYLEPEQVAPHRGRPGRGRVIYEPGLLPVPQLPVRSHRAAARPERRRARTSGGR